MSKLIPIIADAVGRAAGPTLSRIAARIGTAASPAAIMAAVRANPLLVGMVAVELWGAGSDIVKEISAASPEMAEAISAIGYRPDSGDASVDGGLGKFDDEFQLLEQAADILGGFDSFITLRNALKCDDQVVTLYSTLNRTWKRR